MTSKFEPIQRWLNCGGDVAQQDKTDFTKWRHYQLSTRKTKERFFDRNRFPDLIRNMISDELFAEWLHSLGW